MEIPRGEDKERVKLILELGIPYKDMLVRCIKNGIRIQDVNACLVTHGHKDHCEAMVDMLRNRCRVFANSELIERYNGEPNFALTHGQMKVIARDVICTPFLVEHDAPHSFGFIIQTEKETILFINDCKFVHYDLSKYKFDYVCIECNYDGRKIHFAYEKALKQEDQEKIKGYERLYNSHLSLGNCIKLLKRLDLSQCKEIFLMHLSDKNANEYLFKLKVKKELGINTMVCRKDGGTI